MKTHLIAGLLAATSLGACAQLQTANEPEAAAEAYQSMAMEAETKSLNKLASIAIDAHTLYDEAAEEADNEALKAELTTLATSRGDMAKALQDRVVSLGEEADEQGEALGTFHRAFAELRGYVQNDSLTAASEVYRGESYIIDAWNKALEEPMTTESRGMLKTQLEHVKADRDRVEQLKASIEAHLEVNTDADESASKL